MRTCKYCGAELINPSPRRQFCNKDCNIKFFSRKKVEASKKARQAVCANCGKEFIKQNSKQICCSQECVFALNKSQKSEQPKKIGHVCCICGREFKPKFRGEKYCSAECRDDPKARLMRVFLTKAIQKLELKC